ncbi:MAG: ABC transporter permease subunit [Anaerolineae bacterium]
MNIFLRELKANFKSLLIWSGITILFSLVGFSKFSAFYGNPELLGVLDSMPPAVLTALNMDAFNLTTVTGFFGVMVVYYGLILSISAAMWGSDIIVKEERDRTVEFALTLPITRQRLVNAKTAAVAGNCLILLLVCWGITLAGARPFAPDAAFRTFVAVTMLSFLLMQAIFLGLGVLLGCALKSYKRATSLAMSIILGTYFLSILSGLSDKVAFLRYLSPFKYFDPVLMMRESRLEPLFVVLSLAIAIGSLVIAHVAYHRRDLYI